MHKRFRWLCGMLIAVGLFGALPAGAQASRDQLVFELLNRVERLEREVRQLRGDLEVAGFRQDDLERRLQASGSPDGGSGPGVIYEERTPDLQPEIVDRYSNPAVETTIPVVREPSPNPSYTEETQSEPPPVAYGQQPPPVEQSAAPPQVPAGEPASGDEREVYTMAFNGLREGRYSQAISGFESFLQSYPQSELAGNAQYWLGEAYYVNRDFEQAKNAFINLGIRFPNSERVPDTLLKLGYIYEELGDREKAREVLQRLVDNYSGTQAARLGDSRLRSLQ